MRPEPGTTPGERDRSRCRRADRLPGRARRRRRRDAGRPHTHRRRASRDGARPAAAATSRPTRPEPGQGRRGLRRRATRRMRRDEAVTHDLDLLFSNLATMRARIPRQPSDVVKFAYRERAVERVSRHAREPGDDARGNPAAAFRRRRARRPPRAPPPDRRRRRASTGPITSVTSPFGGSRNRAASSAAAPQHDLLEHLRQLAADGDEPRRLGGGEARERRRQALRRLERDGRMRPAGELLPERRPLPLAPAGRSRRTGTVPGEAAGDERRLDGRRPGEHGDRHTRGERRGDEPRAGVVDTGQAGIRDERDPLARDEPRHELRRRGSPRCAGGTRGAAPRSRAARGARACAACPRRATVSAAASSSSTRNVTSARLPIGVAQTASGTPHRTPSSASNATSAAPIRPASSPSSASTIRSVSSAGWIASRPRRRAGRLEHEVAGRGAEASADDHDVGVEDVRRATRSRRRAAGRSRPARRIAPASPARARSTSSGRVGARRRRARLRPGRPRAPRRRPRGGRARGSSPGTAGRPRRRRRGRARPSRDRGGRRSRGRRRRPCPSVSMIRSVVPRPAPSRHSASAAALPSFSTPAGSP